MARALISQNDTGCASRSGRMGLHQLNSSPAWNSLCCQEPCTVPTSNINMQTPAFCSNRHIPRGNFMAASTSESICNPSLGQVLQKAMPVSDSSRIIQLLPGELPPVPPSELWLEKGVCVCLSSDGRH